MNRFALLVILNLLFLSGFAQTIKVSGTLKDGNGDPIPGANVMIKGTAQGTVSDIDGNYTMDAPVGSILVVSFIGFLPMEFEVTESGKAKRVSNKKPVAQPHSESIPQNNNAPQATWKETQAFDTSRTISERLQPGVVVMTSDMKYEINKTSGGINYANLKLKGIRNDRNKKVLVFEQNEARSFYIPQINYSFYLSTDRINNLPSLQKSYTQGRPLSGELTWQGSEYGSPYAWGPPLSQLEFDGSGYDFDANGRLVPLFEGNGKNALSYNPYDVFQNAMLLTNTMDINHKIKKFVYNLGFKNSIQKGVIPNSAFNRNSVNTGFNYQHKEIKLFGKATLTKIDSKNSGGDIFSYHFMKSVLLTPPSFDNRQSSILTNGNQRSSAIGFSDNPYWLLNNSIDNLDAYRFISNINFSSQLWNEFRLNIILSSDKQNEIEKAGIFANSYIFPYGNYSEREKELSAYNGVLNFQLNEHQFNDFKYSGLVSYQVTANKASLNRSNRNSLISNISNPSADQYGYTTERIKHNTGIKLSGNYDQLVIIDLQGGLNYYSDINNYKGYKTGSISGAFFPERVFSHLGILDFVSEFKIFGSYGNTYKTPSLIINGTQYTSLNLSPEEAFSFFPMEELIYNKQLNPEELVSLNLGTCIGFFHNRLNIEASWYQKNTSDAIFPEFATDKNLVLQNSADLKTQGVDINITHNAAHRNFNFRNTLTFTQYKTTVSKLYNQLDLIPLSGFNTIQSCAIENQPLGVLMGTRYLRNDQNQLLIDETGYPMIDAKPGIVGNPTPDWTIGLDNNIQYRHFELSFTWQYKKGGDIWNGTKAALDYYGLSEETAILRDTRNYIFNGVTDDGNPNTTPVDFANPANELDNNRWVRYGVNGVSEEYIEDGSWFRLQNLQISYRTNRLPVNFIRSLNLSLFMNNIMLFTKYSGVDPESALFGQPGGNGLDYFNMPSTKTFGCSIEIKM